MDAASDEFDWRKLHNVFPRVVERFVTGGCRVETNRFVTGGLCIFVTGGCRVETNRFVGTGCRRGGRFGVHLK